MLAIQFSIFEIRDPKEKKISKIFGREWKKFGWKKFFLAHIFWTPGIHLHKFTFLPGINRQSEEEYEWSNSSGIINHRFV